MGMAVWQCSLLSGVERANGMKLLFAVLVSSSAVLAPSVFASSEFHVTSSRAASAMNVANLDEELTVAASSEAVTNSIAIVFSDLDGTLIHYPVYENGLLESGSRRELIQLPPSSTGLTGVISSETLQLCRAIRREGTKLVFVSGMRASTLLKRIPYLPKADAYCCEAGGRIFYPVASNSGHDPITPLQFDGAEPDDLAPFCLSEDIDWRRGMERDCAAGKHGFVGHEIESGYCEDEPIPLHDRDGALWRFARELTEMGIVVDSQGYSTCFRVNRTQQPEKESHFESLVHGSVLHPTELAFSTNLGSVDFYPSSSGKKNCCAYLLKKFIAKEYNASLANRCVCLCDDDNDIDMALFCLHAYVPHVTSSSMAESIRSYPAKFTVTAIDQEEDRTRATERALEMVLKRIGSDHRLSPRNDP